MRIAIIGGGPAGYESALVAAQLGAQVTVVDRDGIGGSCVLTDCVPSKTLIATSDRVTALRDAPRVGVAVISGHAPGEAVLDFTAVNERIKALARQQSGDIADRLTREGVTLLSGSGRFAADQPPRAHRVEVVDGAGATGETIEADVVLVASGGTPASYPPQCPTASEFCPGETSTTSSRRRITWLSSVPG